MNALSKIQIMNDMIKISHQDAKVVIRLLGVITDMPVSDVRTANIRRTANRMTKKFTEKYESHATDRS